MLFTVSVLSMAFADLPLPIYPNCGEADAEELCPNDADDWRNILHPRRSAKYSRIGT